MRRLIYLLLVVALLGCLRLNLLNTFTKNKLKKKKKRKHFKRGEFLGSPFTGYGPAYPGTAKIVARQVARAVAEKRIEFYFSSNLCCNDFGHCRVCYTLKCFVQLILPQCRQDIASKLDETFHSVIAP